MTIYVSHSRHADFNFEKDLYTPLELSNLATFILPHKTSEHINSKELFEKHKCNMVLAECSFPATGQGMELGWANMLNIPIICAYRTGSDVSTSAKLISQYHIEYKNPEDLISQLASFLNSHDTTH